MTVVYIPVYRFAVSYSVSFGRRWTILEHMLLLELVSDRRSAAMLAAGSGLPERLVVEALINLLKAGWIEVRTSTEGAYFKSTAIGARRAADETLQSVLKRRVNWTSMCLDRLTGSWLRTDDLELTHEFDLPAAAFALKPVVSTFEREDGSLRNLVYLASDESFEQFEPNVRPPSLFFAKVNIVFGEPELPAYASLNLRETIRENAPYYSAPKSSENLRVESTLSEQARDTLTADDLIVGGAEHFGLLKDVLEKRASRYVVIHSCFLRERTISDLLPSLELAAQRGVRVDLLWGLNYDPDDLLKSKAVGAARLVLDKISGQLRNSVQLSPVSSGSHAKVLLFDENEGSVWHSVVGSCNFLSSEFDWLEMSLHTRSNRIALQLFGRLMAAQLPPSGAWPTVARRLESKWQHVRKLTIKPEEGLHRLEVLLDRDHYACVTRARDQAR